MEFGNRRSSPIVHVRSNSKLCEQGQHERTWGFVRWSDGMAEQLQSFLRIRQVKALVGLSRSTIYEHIKRGDFPPPVPIGPRAVAWPSSSIAAWQARQIEHSTEDARGRIQVRRDNSTNENKEEPSHA